MMLGWPAAWWLGLLIAPMAALFFFRHRAIKVEIPSVLLWEPRLRPAMANPLGRRFRRPLAFAVETLLLVALIAALSDPKPARDAQSDQVIIIDTSATMQTKERSGSTRFARALSAAHAIISEAPEDSAITVLRAGAFPQVLLRSETDKLRAHAAIDQAKPFDLDSDLQAALKMARGLQTGSRRLRATCLSDFVGADTRELCSGWGSESVALDLIQVGTPQPDAGIVGLTTGEDESQLTVTVAQHGLDGHEATICVHAGKETITQGFKLDAAVCEVAVPVALSPGQVFSVEIQPNDALEIDNKAWGVWPRSQRLKLTLVSEGNRFLEEVLRLEKGVIVQSVSPTEWVHDPSVDITVLDQPQIAVEMPDLGGRFLILSPNTGSTTQPASVPEAHITYWASGHPLLRNAEPGSWGAISLLGGTLWKDGQVLVAADDLPVLFTWPNLAENRRLRTQAVVLNFDLWRSDLPWRPAFPVLIWDAIDYLAERSTIPSEIASTTGSVIQIPVADGTGIPQVRTPDGRFHSMVAQLNRASWSGTEQQGIYVVSSNGDKQSFAMNWFSVRCAEPWHEVLRVVASQPGQWSLRIAAFSWRRILGAAAIALILEWVLYHARVLRLD